MRLRDAVDQQHPRRSPVGVPQELGAALVHPAAVLRLPPARHSRHYGVVRV
jgi:hypothetical protein